MTGNGAYRSPNVFRCCSASRVVGTSTATCLPSITTLNAARTAISVLPNPTSPQINRSIGRGRSRSALTSSIAVTWSPVSSCGNASSSSICHGVSGPYGGRSIDIRTEYSRTSSPAMSLTARLTRPVVRAQSLVPRRDSRGVSPPTYFATIPT